MPDFVLQTGLTRRLISAHDERSAIEKFRAMLERNGRYGRRFTFQRGEVSVRPATPAEVADFRRKPRKPIEGQMKWDV